MKYITHWKLPQSTVNAAIKRFLESGGSHPEGSKTAVTPRVEDAEAGLYWRRCPALIARLSKIAGSLSHQERCPRAAFLSVPFSH